MVKIMENYTTGTGQKLRVHDRDRCSAIARGRGDCVIHQRADTHMKDWPTNWRSSWGGFMEVICPHGIGHPAPEETRSGGFGHGCDGCCSDRARGYAAPEGTVRYSQGGLLRCCIQTLTNNAKSGILDDASEGDELPCSWCSSTMVLVEGVWRWDKSRTPVIGVPVPTDAELAP